MGHAAAALMLTEWLGLDIIANQPEAYRGCYREAAPRVRAQIARQSALVMCVPASQVSMQDFISDPRAPSRFDDPPEVEDGCCVADRSAGLLACV